MKKIFLSVSTLFTLNSYSQCTKCNSLTEAFKNPESVKEISINSFRDGIRLDSLPASIALFKNLEILYFSDQDFKNIPKEIGNLKKLREISFAGCKLESLPAEIYDLPNLKEIVLSDNMFSETYKREIQASFAKLLPKTKVSLE